MNTKTQEIDLLALFYKSFFNITIIVSKTKFSILIGCAHTYISRKSVRDHAGIQLQVSNLNNFELDYWIP